jgi:hypothetical protein
MSPEPTERSSTRPVTDNKRGFAGLLLPRIVRWVHVVEILRAYTMNLDDGFFAGPEEVIGLGLDDYGATGGVTP